MDTELKRAKIFNYTVAVMFLLIFIGLASVVGIWKWNHTFTVSKWMNHPDDRYKIVSSMLSQNKIVGMTDVEIIGLLGAETEKAPEKFKHPRGEFPDASTLTYSLGVDLMDHHWLIISLENGIATSYEIGLT